MEKYSIGLDLGTSSVKAVLFDGTNVLATDSENFSYKQSFLNDNSSYIGFDAREFYNSIAKVLKRLSSKSPKPVSGIAFASASGNTLLCDENGEPMIDAYSWTNKPFSEEVNTFLGAFDKEYVRNTCGWGFGDTMPLSHLSHIKAHQPELIEKATTVCMTTEYVLYRLTGKWGIDRSTATPFYLVDQQSATWHKPYLDALGIKKSQLMPIGETGDLLGETLESVCEETGLEKGTKVYLGSFDHPAGARANGLDREGILLLSCGTSWVEFFPCKDRDFILKNKMLCDPYTQKINGLWGGMFSIPCVSQKIEKIIDTYISDGKDKFDLFNEYSAKASKGADGLKIDLNDQSADYSVYSKENISRALMEAPAYILKEKLDSLIAQGVKFDKVYMAGGPSKSPIWYKIVEEIIGLPIEIKYGVNSGAVGSAMLSF